jgi:hypothetical protein
LCSLVRSLPHPGERRHANLVRSASGSVAREVGREVAREVAGGGEWRRRARGERRGRRGGIGGSPGWPGPRGRLAHQLRQRVGFEGVPIRIRDKARRKTWHPENGQGPQTVHEEVS